MLVNIRPDVCRTSIFHTVTCVSKVAFFCKNGQKRHKIYVLPFFPHMLLSLGQNIGFTPYIKFSATSGNLEIANFSQTHES